MIGNVYNGFEFGPVRPPSESGSMMFRVTRNCPWNKCKFCTLYQGDRFSLRSVEHIKADIDRVKEFVLLIQGRLDEPSSTRREELVSIHKRLSVNDRMAFHSALNWCRSTHKSIFLQDANSLYMKPVDLIEILQYLSESFPNVHRITSYARSNTVAGISDEHLAMMAAAGLRRIHIGMESGSDNVLSFMNKGSDKETHILAGKKG